MGRSRKLRVLVVDDLPGAADSLAQAVQRWGHEADVAGSSAQALEKAAAFRPDVVLLDLGLEAKAGCRLAAELIRRADPAEPVLVAVTGFRDPSRPPAPAGGPPADLSGLERLLQAERDRLRSE